MKRISFLTTLFVSACLSVLLLIVLFTAATVTGAPFTPFNLFDFLTRTLPGNVLTFGIDLIVDTIRTLQLGPTDSTAKLAEQIMSVILTMILLTGSGALFLQVLARRVTATPNALSPWGIRVVGAVLGLLLGIVAGALSTTGKSTLNPELLAGGLWLLVTFAGWGVGHGQALVRLLYATPETPRGTPMPPSKPLPTHVEVMPVGTLMDRRAFLVRLGGVTATVTVVGAGVNSLLNMRQAALQAPVGVTKVTTPAPERVGLIEPTPGTRPEYTPLAQHYRIDINTGPFPQIDPETYRLPITGLVQNPVELSLAQLREDFTPLDQFITMSCISNRLGGDLISTTRWTGILMQDLVNTVNPQPEATHIKITGADGFWEVVALETIQQTEGVMLAYAWDGEALRPRHGFPLRIHIPDRYGMKQPKWITGMEFIPAWEAGYWVERGWDRDALVRATSVIDTVAVDQIIERDGQKLVPVGGIAWAGARGISSVEVRIDEGEWQPAELRQPLSGKTWVIWRYDWQFEAGDHQLSVRCAERDGTPQIEMPEGVRPSGATGLHTRDTSL